MSEERCASCDEILADHDRWQLRICLRNLSDKIWAMRKRMYNPEIQRLIDKYTKKDNST